MSTPTYYIFFYNANGSCIPGVQLWMQSSSVGMAHLFIVFAITITFLFRSPLLLLLRRVFGAKIIAKPICGNYLMCTPRWDQVEALGDRDWGKEGIGGGASSHILATRYYRHAIAFSTRFYPIFQHPFSVSVWSVVCFWSLPSCVILYELVN